VRFTDDVVPSKGAIDRGGEEEDSMHREIHTTEITKVVHDEQR
jgi:hypothetical protein